MASNEEREFQISLAELQADVQIYLSIALAFMGVLITYAIGLEQLYFSLSSKSDVVALSVIISLVVGVVISFIAFRYFISKADRARKKIPELRKKYVQ